MSSVVCVCVFVCVCVTRKNIPVELTDELVVGDPHAHALQRDHSPGRVSLQLNPPGV